MGLAHELEAEQNQNPGLWARKPALHLLSEDQLEKRNGETGAQSDLICF